MDVALVITGLERHGSNDYTCKYVRKIASTVV